ncbi:phosphoglycerate mutase [Hathewaya proteolytica DSM 3090]|uniref:2,3-bisphosphoglycerate-independent phosphoglycerate mutase n=1 Tax=Hathewaya proteolytica DSM 3090 TaxID=1121331 RepID=A0A1M6NTQ4_9CLOT|nr:2,3-bisphosphoglycerate-independent phosphoglycerate mutase [Hathewaya proteolytica]SHJ99035.1 phosphoglycerate mutase [Hathewaya proteolytica DSM 3090]
MDRKPVMLMILDGFGVSENTVGNAVYSADNRNYDDYYNTYPHTTLKASGLDVGLPQGQMGNSEVGHLNIGAGRVIYQQLTRITKDIEEGAFFQKEALNQCIDKAIQSNKSVHLIGLLSDGGVHSHINHLKALIKLCKLKKAERVYLHAVLDGRDVPPKSALKYIKEIESYMDEMKTGVIATVSGRYYAMDRDNRWDRVEKAYDAMVLSKGEKSISATEAVEKSYQMDVTDEFVLPTIIVQDKNETAKIQQGDSVIFFNFRPDRAREITRALNDREFHGFERKTMDLNYVCMTEYDKTIENVTVVYPQESYNNTLGQYVSSKGLSQLRIAETEKYAHVTFFFNGGVEEPNKGEDRILVPSPKVATYDLKPEMSAPEVTEKLLVAIDDEKYDLIILNYANPDMVGHTGDMRAAVKAIEAVDYCLGKVVEKMLLKNGTVFITADHGNSEEMVDLNTGKPMTAHTTNEVPFLWISNESKNGKLRENGILADIAPTILHVMGLCKPTEMTGISLINS